MQRDSGAWRVCGASCVLVIGVLLTGGIATPAEEPQVLGAFFEPLEVPLVSLEVFVSDSEGRPVPGLTADDFQVLDDGEPVQISHFYASPSMAGGQAEAAAEDAEREEPPPGASQDLYLAVYVDETNFNLSQRAAVLDNLRTFFTQELPERLRVMLVSYDNTMQVRQPLTDDPELLLSAMESLKYEASLSFDQIKNDIMKEVERNANPNLDPAATASAQGGDLSDPDHFVMIAESVLREIESYAKQRKLSNERNIAALQSFIRSLSGLPGRKAVLYLSNGLEIRAGEDLFDMWERSFEMMSRQQGIHAMTRANRYNIQNDLSEMVEFANSYRVSFYTLRSSGQAFLNRVSAATQGVGGTSGIGLLTDNPGEDGLVLMTSATGGRTLANNQRLGEQLTEVAEELGSYYSLGYRPQGSADEYHTLKVEVSRPGVRVRHREGYRIQSVANRMEDRTLSAAIHGINENPLGISAAAAQQLPRDDGSFTVPLLIKVPLDQIVLMPLATTHEGRISVFVVVRDRDGRLSDCLRREYPVQIQNEKLLQAITQKAGFTMSLLMREGPQVVAVGVRDELADVESTVTLDITVGDTEQSA